MSDIKALQKQLAEISGTISRLAGEQSIVLFRDFASEYLKLKLSNPTLRYSTKQSFENQVKRHLIPAFGALPLDKIKNGVWLQWVTDMIDQKKITRFFNSRKVLIEILRAAMDQGLVEKLPKFDNPDEIRDVGRVLSTKEILSIIWKARRPFRFIFFTFWKLGCRPREILRWEWSMLRPDLSWIDIPSRISKTGRSRSIPLNSDVVKILQIRKRLNNGSHFIFPSRNDLRRPQLTYQSAFTVACRHAKIEKAMVYDFRRSFVTRCAAEGKPLLYIAKYLDSSIAMLEKTYAKSQREVMEELVK